MKNIFAVRYQKEAEKVHPDGEHFITRRIDEQQSTDIDEFDHKIKALNSKVKLPIWLLVIYYVMMFLSVTFIMAIIGALQEVNLTTSFTRAPWIYIALPFTILGWAAIAIYKRTNTKKVTQGSEVKDLQKEAEQIIQNSREQLGIPDSAHKVDTLHYFYEEKDGKMKMRQGLGAQYFNIEMNAYIDEDNFYLADLTRVFTFSKKDLVSLSKIKKTVSMDVWNKKETFNSSKYIEFRIKTNSTGSLFIRSYYELILKHNDEQFSVLFPAYEGQIIQELTALSIVEDKIEE